MTQVLSRRAINRATLDRQLLLSRSGLPVIDAVERLVGLQAQTPHTWYVGLWSRLAGFVPGQAADLLVDRRLIRIALMRSTIHLVSRADYPLFAAGTRRFRREWWERASRSQLAPADVERAAALASTLLANGPMRQKELQAAFAAEGLGRLGWTSANIVLDLVRVPPSGTWERRRADLYGLAEAWLGPIDASEADGLDLLLRR